MVEGGGDDSECGFLMVSGSQVTGQQIGWVMVHGFDGS